MHNNKLIKIASCLIGFLLMTCATVSGAENKLLNQPADISHKAVQSVMLAMDNAGSRQVVVGERGFILLSDDEGQNWKQVQAPVSVTLTSVAFVSPDKGWIVGHGGVVLKTVDGGNSWVKILDGIQAAAIELEAAQAVHDPDNRRSKMRMREALFSVKSGADKPFLDVHFSDEMHGTIVGAYGLAFTTDDGGENWQSIMGQVPNTYGMHLYDIYVQDEHTYLIGEQGSLFRSKEDGSAFERIETPYEGSFFGMISSKNADLILYGLRGNVFRSTDGGNNWQNIILPLPITLTSGTLLKDGGIILVDETGQVLLSRDQGESYTPITVLHPSAFTDVIETPSGDLLLSGIRGTSRISVDNLKVKVTGNE
mgnify:CR=1 FL=1|tara:strand:+ start:514 stop:1614 length:1101 start_codon:yes stop_codon:yes gene_type:complete